ncbi:MAG TPA: 50S ribosomal protein L25 [Chitinophagaceae bacterium]|nr:50S ribosomal protein L25 [Chitinophagaceae bacterium]
MKTITIQGQRRKETGKKATRRLRSGGEVPCIIYGGSGIIHFQVPRVSLKNLVYTPDFQLADIHIDGIPYRCVLKDLQFDPVTDVLSHVDFLELVEDKKITVNMPVKYTGQPVGVKDGGKLDIKLKSLKVRTYPRDLKEHIEVSTEHLEMNRSVRVEDLKLKGFEILNSPRIPLATVAMIRVLKEETPTVPSAASATATAATTAAPAPAAGPAQPVPPAKGSPSRGEKKK